MPLGWFVLKEYQKQRILVFLNPDIGSPLDLAIILFSLGLPLVQVRFLAKVSLMAHKVS